MESIAVRGPSEAEYVTGDELAQGMNMPPCTRAILTTILTFTGPGTFTALTPTTGTRLAIVRAGSAGGDSLVMGTRSPASQQTPRASIPRSHRSLASRAQRRGPPGSKDSSAASRT